jgi:hypothetical protein
MALIVRQPDFGTPCPEIRAGYHRFPCEAHILFYCVTERDRNAEKLGSRRVVRPFLSKTI